MPQEFDRPILNLLMSRLDDQRVTVSNLCVAPSDPAVTAKKDHVLGEALRLITTALDLLDENGTVGSIGAQLDLARARLADHIVSLQPAGSD